MEIDILINNNNWTFSNNESISKKVIEVIEKRASLAILLLCFSIITVFGNVLVIIAVIREKYLHNVTNYFVASLAVADCLVGLVLMPFSAIYQIFDNTWFFGSNWCEIYRSLDVLFSTASILNLCVISLDRYLAITDPFTYPTKMTTKKSIIFIILIWLCSCLISFPAILWWRAVRNEPIVEYTCPFTENLVYLLFSSTISFYLPLVVMLFTYWKIYRAAAKQTKSLKTGMKLVACETGEPKLTLRMHRGGRLITNETTSGSAESKNIYLHSNYSNSDENIYYNSSNNNLKSGTGIMEQSSQGKNFSISRKLAKFAKEKKAAKTLGIVMGVFVICWSPFFIFNLLSGFCRNCIWKQEILSTIFTWLGWINSGMNPAIYAFWSKEFRRAFARILCKCCPKRMRRRYYHSNNRYKYQRTLRNQPVQVCHHVALQTVMSVL